MPRGGKRKGAGRPKGTGKFGEPTKAVRLPISMIDDVLEFIKRKKKAKARRQEEQAIKAEKRTKGLCALGLIEGNGVRYSLRNCF